MEANLEAQEHDALIPSKNENPSKLKDDDDDDSTHISFPPKDMMSFTINIGKRPNRDTVFKFLFLGTILLTYGIGIVAFTRADFTKLQRSKFNPATNECEQGGSSQETDDNDGVLKLMAIVPLSVMVMTFPVGLIFFWLLHRYTRGLVMVLPPLLSMVPFGLYVCWVTWCYGINEGCATEMPTSTQIFYAVYMPGLSALSAYQLWKNFSRNTFEVTVELLKMATKALKDHFWLLVLNPVMLLGSMVLVNGPIVTFIWYAVNNNHIVPNFDVLNDLSKGCYYYATGYPCCREQRPAWVSAYVALAVFTASWVFMVMIQLQILVVSGTVAHWYFAPAGSSSTMGNIKRSLRNAFGPSFGTACNLGTIITTMVVAIMGLVKKATNRVLNSCSYRQGIISNIVRGCVSWMTLDFPECHPRFAVNFAAISGDSFWESSKKANQLLQRNSLSTIGIFSFLVHHVFISMSFIYGILQSFVVYSALEYFTDMELQMSFIVIIFCFVATMTGLGQFHQAIASVIDTVYICYAMEKDVGEISKPEVCHAYTLLPPEKGAMHTPEDKLNAL